MTYGVPEIMGIDNSFVKHPYVLVVWISRAKKPMLTFVATGYGIIRKK
jgi:hypothetical protein